MCGRDLRFFFNLSSIIFANARSIKSAVFSICPNVLESSFNYWETFLYQLKHPHILNAGISCTDWLERKSFIWLVKSFKPHSSMWTSIRMKRLVLSMIRCCSLRATYYCMQANFLHYVLLVQLWANSTNNMSCSTSKSEPHNINCLCGIGMKLEFIRFIYNSALTLIHSVVKRTSVVKRCQSKRWQKHRVCYRFRIMPVFFSVGCLFFWWSVGW